MTLPALFDRLEARLLDACAFLVIFLMLCVSAQVFFNFLDISVLARFQTALPLLGTALTLNSLLELQWHLLAVIAFVPAGLVWLRDGHIRVDFLLCRMSSSQKQTVDIIGNILFAVPFLSMCIPASWAFAMRAFASAEASSNGGLADRYLVKGVVPFGLALLALAILIDLWKSLRDVSVRT